MVRIYIANADTVARNISDIVGFAKEK